MKKLNLIALLLLVTTLSFAQSFEGKLTYVVEFDITAQKIGDFEITETQILDKMKEEGAYFDTIIITIKEGNYIKKNNSNTQETVIYLSDSNNVYVLQKDFEFITITDASKISPFNIEVGEYKLIKSDTTKSILGTDCEIITLSWGTLGTEQYCYNKDMAPIDPKLFENHIYEGLNTVLNITHSYPLEIKKTMNDFISVKMTLVNYADEKIDDAVFVLPAMEAAEKEYSDLMLQMTGSRVMKIK